MRWSIFCVETWFAKSPICSPKKLICSSTRDDNDASDHLFFRDLRSRRGARRCICGKRHQTASRKPSVAIICRSVLGLDGDRWTLLRDLFLGALPAFPAALFSRSHGRVCVDRRIYVYQRALELFLLPHPQSLPCVFARPALQRRRDFSLSRAPAPTRQNRRLVPSPVPPLPFFLRESLGLSHLEIEFVVPLKLTLRHEAFEFRRLLASNRLDVRGGERAGSHGTKRGRLGPGSG